MKLIIIFLITAILQVSARSYAQNITLHQKNVSIDKVIEQIRVQSGYDFFYNKRALEKAGLVTINAENASLKEVLDQCFTRQPLTYIITNNAVIIKEIKMVPGKVEEKILETTGMTFKGQIINAVTQQPIPYATVTVLNSKVGTVADATGFFQLSGIETNDKIIIRSVGFKQVELPVMRLLNSANTDYPVTINDTKVLLTGAYTFKIAINQSVTSLDETVVVAYGTTSQRYTVGSVSTVTSKEIEAQPVSNVLQALQGRVPGLIVTMTNGAPGAATLTQVRGQNTLANTPDNLRQASNYNQPLYIVDGVPVATQNNNITAASLAGRSGAGYFSLYNGLSPLNTINPADIESVSVLKDADATSIYGSQGSNGVILITTKRGKAGNDQLSVSVNSGVTSASRTPEMMNTAQYLAMRAEANKNGNHIATETQDADLTIYDQGKYTDFVKQYYGGTAKRTDLHLSLSGGSENTNYLISGGETHQTYNFPGGFADNRLSLHTSFSHKSKDNKLTVDFGTDYAYSYNNSTGAPNVTAAFTLAPNSPDFIDANGNLVWNYKGFNLGSSTTQSNPLAYLQQLANSSISNLNTHLQIGYQILPTLKLAVNGGYNRITNSNYSGVPILTQNPDDGNLGQASFSNNFTELINLEPQLNFFKRIGKGSLSVVLGGTYRRNNSKGNSVFGYNYSSDALLSSIAGAGGRAISDNSTIYKYIAGFTRINYVWDGKYIANVTANRNGSSNFGPNKRFGNFGSAGLGWIISEESFIKNTLPFLSYAKLSGNYGTSGSDGIAPYQYQPNWSATNDATGYQGFSGLYPLNPLNPTYAWSVNKKFNESIDLGFIQNRIILNVTAYQNKSSNQLVDYKEPITTGFSSITANAPYTVENKGIEFSINTRNIEGKSFQWTTNFNISRNSNKLTAFPDLASSPYAGYYMVGKSTNARVLIPFTGVDPATGYFNYRKQDGTVVYNPSSSPGINGLAGDATEYVDLTPKFSGGFNNTFTYKGFSLSFFFQFAKQIGQNFKYSLYQIPGSIPGNAYNNLPVQLLSTWQKAGDVSEFQRLTGGRYSIEDRRAATAANLYALSTGAYSDASYIRLKNVAFAYNIPQTALSKLFIKSCTFYINAENLALFTHYKVGDPETQSLYNIPPQRTIVAGLNLNF